MKYCMITFRSVTPAQRGESVLSRAGFECSIQRTPRWMEEKGCGYAVEAKLADLSQGTNLLRRKGIPFRKGYRLTGDGTAEEVTV